MGSGPARVAVIGCGRISGIYCDKLRQFPGVQVYACCDLVPARAAASAAEFGIPRVYTPDEVLADDAVDVVLNLTVPESHADISLAALRAGKSVYSEKPLALNVADGQRLLGEAAARNLRIGCAPDTFLGGGYQTARQLLDAGTIGEPVAAVACMTCHGHEHWHPEPHFYYQPGGGPLFDMGPYYLTALIHLLGPVRQVQGLARTTFPQRTITSQPHAGRQIDVRVPTHVSAALSFASGPIATVIMSFDIWHANLPFLEVYGEIGSLSLPDPNTFGGPVLLRCATDKAWREQPLREEYLENSRGLGLAEMVAAMRGGRPHRAGGELALHVLEIMQAIHESAAATERITLKTSCRRPAALPTGLPPGKFD